MHLVVHMLELDLYRSLIESTLVVGVASVCLHNMLCAIYWCRSCLPHWAHSIILDLSGYSSFNGSVLQLVSLGPATALPRCFPVSSLPGYHVMFSLVKHVEAARREGPRSVIDDRYQIELSVSNPLTPHIIMPRCTAGSSRSCQGVCHRNLTGGWRHEEESIGKTALICM